MPEAAHYLRVPVATLRSWVVGRYYPTESGRKFSKPIIDLPDRESTALSFVNLVEAHVLSALRKEHRLTLPVVRRAVDYLRDQFGHAHPLADKPLETDGLDLFLQRFEGLINVSRAGQLALRDILRAHLTRIDRDKRTGAAIRLYPFTRIASLESPRSVVIDPFVSFGRPVLAGTGIATAAIADRYRAGDAIDLLAEDYGRTRAEIEEAIRCEFQSAAA